MNTKSYIIGMATLVVMLLAACHDSHADEDGHGHGQEAKSEAHDDGHEHEPDIIEFSPAQTKAAGLELQTVRPTEFSEVVEVSGQVLPASGAEATVTATMAGIVSYATQSLTEGAQVQAGQTLFTVNGRPMADGNPAAVAQSELDAAGKAYERAKKLAADHIISQRELEDARLRYESALATSRSLGNAAQMRALSAPIGGYVKQVMVKPGDYVAAGQALATVTQSRRLQLRADVPERCFAMLPRVTSANFRMAYDEEGSVYSIQALSGRLVSKGRSGTDGSRFVPVVFEFNNQGHIVPGSLAEVFLKGASRSGVLTVPQSALTEAQGLHFVYVQVHDGEYRRQEVKTGATDGQRVEIVDGLKAGDKVVTRGATQVRLAANATAVPEGHTH